MIRPRTRAVAELGHRAACGKPSGRLLDSQGLTPAACLSSADPIVLDPPVSCDKGHY